jgi:hypothetical protein
MLAVYISATQFRVEDDLTSEFTAGRRIKADCGVDGIKYSTVQSSSYSSPNTTVTITESVLTSNLIDVLYGIINTGSQGSLPEHSHGGIEGHGGRISFADLTNKSTLTLDDMPGIYDDGKFLKSTTSGFVLDDTPNQTVFSGTEVFVNGDATVTGTVYAHVYDSYSPLTIKDGGTNVIVGNGAGKVDFPNGITVSGSPAVGPRGVHGVMGTQGPGWLSGIGPPSVNDGDLFDYYLDESTGDVYRKDDGTMSSNLITDQDACSSDRGAAANVIIGDSMWNVYDPWSASSEGPWWEYDFGADNDKVVVSVTITQGWGGYTFGPGYIYGSNDGIFYYTLDRFNNGSVGGQTDTMTFVNRTPYRYIRVQYDAEGWHVSTGIAYLSMSYFTDVDWQLSTNIKGSDGATVSGTTSSGGASTFLELTDTPSSYSEGRFLQSTASGIVFATASGIPGPAGADGVDGGNWVLVDSVDVNNSTFSKSVSINGNVDKRMRIDFRFTKSPTSGSDMYTRFNNDSTSNYSYSYITQTPSATGGYNTASDLNLFGGYYGTDEVAGTSNLWLETGGRRLARSEIVLYRLTVTNQAQTVISTRWHDTSTNITSIDVGSTSACTGTIKFYKWQDITEAINTTFIGLDDTPTTYSGTAGLFAVSTGSGIGFSELVNVPSTFEAYKLLGEVSASSSSTIDIDNPDETILIECINLNGSSNLRINEDTGTNYSWGYVNQDGSSTGGGYYTTSSYELCGSNDYSSSTTVFYPKNTGSWRHIYSTVTKYKSSNTDLVAQFLAGWWKNTSADVTSITITNNATLGVVRVYSRGQVSIPLERGSTAINTTFIGLDDTPATYSGTEGQFAVSTGSGIDFTDGQISDGRQQTIFWYSDDVIHPSVDITLNGTTFSGSLTEITTTSGDGLIQEFLFEGDGTQDTSGYNNDLTLSTAVMTGGLVYGSQAIDFGPAGEANASLGLSGTATHSISAWLKMPDTLPGSRIGCFTLGPQNTGGHHWLLDPSGSMSMGIWSVNSVAVYLSAYLGEWVHVVSTYNGSDYYAYVNGGLAGSFSNSSMNLNGTTILGEGVPAEGSWTGLITNFRVFNKVLSNSEIQDLRNEFNLNLLLQSLKTSVDSSSDYSAVISEDKLYVKGNDPVSYTITTSSGISYEKMPREISFESLIGTSVPGAGQVLKRNDLGTGYEWVDYTTTTAYGMVYRTTSKDLTAINNWEDVEFDSNGTLVGMSHSTTSGTEQLVIGQSGTYEVTYYIHTVRGSSDRHVVSRVVANTTEIVGSYDVSLMTSYTTGISTLSKSAIVELGTNDILKLQMGASVLYNPTIDAHNDANLPDSATKTTASLIVKRLDA